MITRIAKQKVLAIVLAGGRGSRLSPLTDERAKPAVPFLGTYRLIDFTLSNLVHSGVHDVWVIEQYMPHGLNDHLSGGRPWDLDRTRGGLVVMPPFSHAENEEGEFAQGNAHALAQHAHLIREFGPDVVLVLSADHVYKLDYSEVIRAHVDHGASVTMVTTELSREGDATRFGNVRADRSGKVTEFAYKPDKPLGPTVTAEVFVYEAGILLSALKDLEAEGELGDYGEKLLPRLVARGDAYTFPMEGYWMDVGTLDAYLQTHRDFLDGKGFGLDDPEWPFITSSISRPPTRIEKTAHLDAAFVCGGAVIAGEVVRSVVAPNAVIERGAVVRDSVIQPGAVVRAGAQVSRAVIDQGAEVGPGARVGGQSANSRPTVVGAYSHVGEGAQIGAGQVAPPRSRVVAGQESETVQALDVDNKAGKK
ncbi:glucose-1-phosphate adenylyltransferase [Deinococcus reticulitermitis]|uniref:Glucose-1-phosphate adenylyltransferase n=1 Tax=Deinococcus reticulitermitis TaxID=856736 RepID=A0A1H6WX15_9DEIO|nr:glucose-1-phosphate adenylyltransferase family protein [Deinococcus reticulitermitis]SEJ17310.1 glucose-1-phosphate adenylyltransferase [Deinococcus reticulitermitis]